MSKRKLLNNVFSKVIISVGTLYHLHRCDKPLQFMNVTTLRCCKYFYLKLKKDPSK